MDCFLAMTTVQLEVNFRQCECNQSEVNQNDVIGSEGPRGDRTHGKKSEDKSEGNCSISYSRLYFQHSNNSCTNAWIDIYSLFERFIPIVQYHEGSGVVFLGVFLGCGFWVVFFCFLGGGDIHQWKIIFPKIFRSSWYIRTEPRPFGNMCFLFCLHSAINSCTINCLNVHTKQ